MYYPKRKLSKRSAVIAYTLFSSYALALAVAVVAVRL